MVVSELGNETEDFDLGQTINRVISFQKTIPSKDFKFTLELLKEMLSNALQSENVSEGKSGIKAPKYIETKELHPLRTLSPKVLTLSGIDNDSNDLQPPKTESPIICNEAGKSIDFNELQPEKAELLIAKKELELRIATDFNELHP